MPEPVRVARNVMIFSYFKNIFRQKTDSSQADHADGYIKYGPLDNFPIKLAKLIEDSTTGSACLSTLTDFIEGNGFSSDNFSETKINARGETFGELHSKVSESIAKNEGFYINVKYSATGKKTEFYFLPFENCRLEMPDKNGDIQFIQYNPYFGTSLYKKSQTERYRIYNPKAAAAQLKSDGPNFLGQVYYYATNKALHRFYPEPEYYSAADWFEVDAGIGGYWKNNLKNSFLQSVIFKIIGDPTQESKDPKYQVKNTVTGEYESKTTVGQAWSDTMSENFSGVDRLGNIMTFWANSKDEFPDIQAFPSDAKAEIFKIIQETTTKNITIATKVPAILANIQEGVSIGGDGKTIQAAVKLMQQRVVKKHHILERTYKELLSESVITTTEEINIVHYDPYPEDAMLDPSIWQELTPEERRLWISKNTDIELLNKQAPAQPAPPAQPPPATNVNPKAVLYNNYPDAAKANAARALKYKDNGQLRCGTKNGWAWAERLSKGEAFSYKEIKRMKNFLVKNEQYKNMPFERCEPVMYHMWGGKAFQDWAENKVQEVEG